jgi:G:T-mismatch repair DNA endonuclease (very short patch repair protein)
LRRLGWKVLTVWECELKNAEKLRARLARFLSDAAD